MNLLDLGCGENKIPGAIGLDNVRLKDVDVVHDLLEFPYPFDNKIFDTIYLKHVIEHFKFSNINKIFNECSRLLVDNGNLVVTVPHVFSIAAFSDISHKSYFTFGSGYFWNKDHQKSYYDEIESIWVLKEISCRLKWFDWKRPKLKKLDKFLSLIMQKRINIALKRTYNPALADRLVNKYSFQFVEINWNLQKFNS